MYRVYTRNRREQSSLGRWMGPGIVLAQHGISSVWVQFGGRLFLVAKEHLRLSTSEEDVLHDDDDQRLLQELKTLQARPEVLEDLTGKQVPPGFLPHVPERGSGREDEVNFNSCSGDKE